MKTFKDLKPGDKVYYWDHGKLHEQIVNRCEIVEKEQSWTNWRGDVDIHRYNELVLQAGKGQTYSLRYGQNDSTCIFGGMKYFADYESVKKWLNERKEYCLYKVNKFQRKINRYQKLAEKYS